MPKTVECPGCGAETIAVDIEGTLRAEGGHRLDWGGPDGDHSDDCEVHAWGDEEAFIELVSRIVEAADD